MPRLRRADSVRGQPGVACSREGLPRPGVGSRVLVRELAKRERPSHTPAELGRDRVELHAHAFLERGVPRHLREVAVRGLPLEPSALEVGGHERGD